MYKFKIGDVCIGRNLVGEFARFNNIECTIANLIPPTEQWPGSWYMVDWANGETHWTYIKEPYLKLKRPPEELSGWERIEEICGFSPVKVEEKV